MQIILKMKGDKIKKILDYVPLIILTIYALILIWDRFNNDILFQWKHVLALILLPVNFYLFKLYHKLGVVALGATLIFGLIGIISFSPSITINTISWTPNDLRIPIFYGQPIFLLWILIHLIFSARYYVAIATKKYWTDIKENIQLKNGSRK